MLSNNTYLIHRKVMRLRYLISTVCFEISKRLILCSQWGQSKQHKWYVSLPEKHKYSSYTYRRGSWMSDAFSKSYHFPTGLRVFTLPKSQATNVNTEPAHRGSFQYGGAQILPSCCVSKSKEALGNLNTLKQWPLPGNLEYYGPARLKGNNWDALPWLQAFTGSG